MPGINEKLKIVIVGPKKSGKTKLMTKFCHDIDAYKEEYVPTVGASFGTFEQIAFWDTTGSPRFITLIPIYLKDTRGVLITCDLTDKDALLHAQDWLNKVKENAPKDATIIFVATKADDKADQVISNEAFQKFAEDNNSLFFFTSAKTNEGVRELLNGIKQAVKPEILPEDRPQNNPELIKVLCLGSAESGKTQLVSRYVNNKFEDAYQPTIGADSFSKIQGNAQLKIFDMAGTEKYKSKDTNALYEHTHIALITCDLCDEKAFEKTNEDFAKAKEGLPKEAKVIFVGTKSDGETKITNDKFQAYAKEKGCDCFITSAKNNANVNELFAEVAELGIDIEKKFLRQSKLSDQSQLIEKTYSELKVASDRLEKNLMDFIRDKVIVKKDQNANTSMQGYLGIDQYTDFSDKGAHERLFKPADQNDAMAVKQQYELLMKIKAKSFEGDPTLEAKEGMLRNFAERFSKELNNGKLEDVFNTPNKDSAKGWIALKILATLIGGIIIPAIAFAAHAYMTTGSANFFKGKHERLRETLSEKVEKTRNIPKQ